MSYELHIIPGFYWTIYGLWWALMTFWLDITKPTSKIINNNIRKSSYIPQPFLKNIPIESIVKILSLILRIYVEYMFNNAYSLYMPYVNGVYNNVKSVQHVTMFLGFLISGILDIINIKTNINFPKHTTKLFWSIGFFCEGIMFTYHTMLPSNSVRMMMHTLIMYTALSSCLFSALRMIDTHNILINSCLSASLILHGTWYIQLAVTVFGSNHVEYEADDNLRFAINVFIWHIFGISVSLLIIYTLLQKVLKINAKGIIVSNMTEDDKSKLNTS